MDDEIALYDFDYEIGFDTDDLKTHCYMFALNRDVNRCIVQAKRVEWSYATLLKENSTVNHVELEMDIYFYLITCNLVRRVLFKLSKGTYEPTIFSDILNKHEVFFDNCKQIRDGLEHYDDRISREQAVAVGGYINNKTFSVKRGNETFNISIKKGCENVICSIYEEVIANLKKTK